MHLSRFLALVLCACSPPPAATGTSTPSVATTSTTPTTHLGTTESASGVVPAPSGIRLQSFECSYGGSSTAVFGVLGVQATRALHNARVRFEVYTPEGAFLARSTGTVMLRVASQQYRVGEPSVSPGTPFNGETAAGSTLTLQYMGGIELPDPMVHGPVEIRVTLADSTEEAQVVCMTQNMIASS